VPRILRLTVSTILLGLSLAAVAQADDGGYPIKADDGAAIANHRVSAEVEGRIEKLPGIVIAGNPHGKVTLSEFYDVNCPYCRAASADIDALVRGNPQLRLVLVPFPVLGIPSIQGTRVELAVARLVPAQKFYAFHRQLDATRGVVDGNRALAAAEAIGLDVAEVLKIANDDSLADVMTAHLHLGDALAIAATPGFVIKGVVIVGYPGPKALAKVVRSVQRCGEVVCPSAPR
jgi:protein-disulfide isomerase